MTLVSHSQTVDKVGVVDSLFFFLKLYSGKVFVEVMSKKWYNKDVEKSDNNDDEKRKYRKVQYDIFNSRRASSTRP